MQQTLIKVSAPFGDALCETQEEIQLHIGREIPDVIFKALVEQRVIIHWNGFKFNKVLYPRTTIHPEPFQFKSHADIVARWAKRKLDEGVRQRCLKAMGMEAHNEELAKYPD